MLKSEKPDIDLAVLRTILDQETGIFMWLVDVGKKRLVGFRAGSLAKNGYWVITLYGKKYYGHRLAWFYVHGEWPQFEIDHRQPPKSDNRLSNLRPATHSQNLCHQGLKAHSTTGIKGVYFDKRAEAFVARLTTSKQTLWLGQFPNKEEAGAAYDIAAIKHHGEFAITNFPKENYQ